MKVETPSMLLLKRTSRKALLALTLCLVSCKAIILNDLQENEEAFNTRKIYKNKFEFTSIRKSSEGPQLKQTDLSKYQLIFSNINEKIEIRFFAKDETYERLHENFTEKSFSTIIPAYLPFENYFKVDLFLLANSNYFLNDEVDVKKGRIRLFFNINNIESTNEIGNRLMRVVSLTYHELLHVDSAMRNIHMALIDEEMKASIVEFCSLFYMPAFSKLSLNNKSFKNHNYNFLNKNLEVSKNGFYLAREKIFELTNKKMITKTDLIDNKKIKASCNDL